MITLAPILFRVVQLLYFMAPAYAANMAPPFVRYWSGWNPPLSQRWLGSHKTAGGFAIGVLAAVVATFVQSRIAWKGALAAPEPWLTLGLRFGLGAMAGDTAKSFLKRRAGIAAGRPWIPWDEIDFVLGALARVWGAAALARVDVAPNRVLSVIGHVLVNHLAYWLGIRNAKW